MTAHPLPGVHFPVPYDADGNVIWPEANPDSPFFITGPALISFSGGRTSAFMLFQILWAHGGVLPADVHVCFANTGKEREETLRFVHECATRWGVHVVWLEWLAPSKPGRGQPRFAEVGYNSAARDGEPFSALIKRKQYLPNSQMRYCTIELKIRVMRDYMKSLGYKRWENAVGLRYDEGSRVLKALDRNASGKDIFTAVLPLSKAKVTVRHVGAFWEAQPFDLQLLPHEGNCDLCFLKGRKKRAEIIANNPDRADWWIAQERSAKCSKPSGARFHKGETYTQLRQSVIDQPMMALPSADDGDEADAECGLWCGA